MDKTVYFYILIYFVIINFIGFILMGIDKKRAEKKKWRIQERTLFFTAIIGGSLGVLIGMWKFRHKTKHGSFVVGIPLIIVFQCVLFVAIQLITKSWK